MDLGTIKDRLEGGKHYKDEKEVSADGMHAGCSAQADGMCGGLRLS